MKATTASHRRNCRTATTTDVVSAISDIRPSRKCFSFYGCLFTLILLLTLGAQQATCRPGQNDELLPPHFNVDEEFRDVDNLEIHHVKVVNGMLKEDHPIIMYKEDFVDENYVPDKNDTKPQRKYKDIAHRRRHKTTTVQPDVAQHETEKIYFDFVPETPIMVPDDSGKHKKSHIKLVPLMDEMKGDTDSEAAPSKNELQKRPKKFHRRVRRDASADEHIVRKRNPYFRHVPKNSADVPPAQSIQYVYVKHAVPGKKHNGLDIPVTKKPSKGQDDNTPISFDNRVAADENDRVIFSSGPRTTSRPRPLATRRPTESSIFRDPRPENFDFSFMNQGQSGTSTTSAPIYTRRPMGTRPPESIFRDPSPDNYDFSFMNQGQAQSSSAAASSSGQVSTSRPSVSRAPQAEPAGISQCVWAIVNCCSNRNNEIRYSCFEQNGCYGAFWGLNPCAENVRDNLVGFVADYYN